MEKSLEEQYTELSKKIHDERSKPANKCDMDKVRTYEAQLTVVEAGLGVKRLY